jgi:hypothetical protein
MSRIRYDVDDRVATVTIDRPDERDAVTFADLADDDREGVAAFLERRPARFTGR